MTYPNGFQRAEIPRRGPIQRLARKEGQRSVVRGWFLLSTRFKFRRDPSDPWSVYVIRFRRFEERAKCDGGLNMNRDDWIVKIER